MKTIISTTALAVALAAAPAAFAQDTTGSVGGYDRLDANADLALTQDEFRPFVDQTYDAWETSGDDFLDEPEFAAGLYRTWDVDRDETLTREEYDRGYASWFQGLDVEDSGYEALGGGPQGLSQEDFLSAAAERDYYDAWTSGRGERLDRETFAETMYERSAGEDGSLTKAEFEAMYPGG